MQPKLLNLIHIKIVGYKIMPAIRVSQKQLAFQEMICRGSELQFYQLFMESVQQLTAGQMI